MEPVSDDDWEEKRIRIQALNAAVQFSVGWNTGNKLMYTTEVIPIAKQFEDYIRNGAK